MNQTKSQTFRAHSYKLLDTFDELEGKTIKAVMHLSGSKTLFVTDATMLVTAGMAELSGASVYNSGIILTEIEDLTGVTKNQFIYNGMFEGIVMYDRNHLKEFVENDTLSPEWLEKAKAWHTTPREVPDWYKKLGPDPQVKYKW